VVLPPLVGLRLVVRSSSLILSLHLGLRHAQPRRVLNGAEKLGPSRLAEAQSGQEKQ